MTVADRFISVNGLRLHYRDWGPASATPVVLLHGGCAHAYWWDTFAAHLTAGYRPLALDLRGHGDSQWADPPAYHTADYAADLAAVVDTLGLDRFHLIGHSLGAMVAGTYAGQAPARLASLVLVDSAARMSTSGARYLTRLRNFPQPIFRDHAQAVQRFRLLPTQTNASQEVLATVAAHGIRERPDGRWTYKFDREALAHQEPQDLVPTLQQLTCPILLVRGIHSTFLPHDRFTALLAALPRATGVEIPDAHHHIMLDNAEGFTRAVRTFLDHVAHS